MTYVKFKPYGKWHVVFIPVATWCGRRLYHCSGSAVVNRSIVSRVVAHRKQRPVPIGALCKHCRQAGGQ